jgi:hypothetical protein
MVTKEQAASGADASRWVGSVVELWQSLLLPHFLCDEIEKGGSLLQSWGEPRGYEIAKKCGKASLHCIKVGTFQMRARVPGLFQFVRSKLLS